MPVMEKSTSSNFWSFWYLKICAFSLDLFNCCNTYKVCVCPWGFVLFRLDILFSSLCYFLSKQNPLASSNLLMLWTDTQLHIRGESLSKCWLCTEKQHGTFLMKVTVPQHYTKIAHYVIRAKNCVFGERQQKGNESGVRRNVSKLI